MYQRLIMAVLCATMIGCAPWSQRNGLDYTTVEENPVRNPERAQTFHARALAKLDAGDTVGAEQLIQRALIEDVGFGPAHNSLGSLYFRQGKLYLAAWEFEYAMREMEGRAEPHNNLGLVYESVRKFDDAIACYEAAVALDPRSIEYLSNLARAKVRRGDLDDETILLLDQVAFGDDRPGWRSWAMEQLEVFHASRPRPSRIPPSFDSLSAEPWERERVEPEALPSPAKIEPASPLRFLP